MEQRKYYALLDTTTQAYLNVINFINDADAIRWFKTCVNGNKQESNVARYPHQFILYRISDFDMQLGLFTNTIDGKEIKTPKELIIGTSLVEAYEEQVTLNQQIAKLTDLLQNKIVTLVSRDKSSDDWVQKTSELNDKFEKQKCELERLQARAELNKNEEKL